MTAYLEVKGYADAARWVYDEGRHALMGWTRLQRWGFVPAELPLGSYLYEKWGRTCHVTVFLMEVSEVKDDWPERGLRQRAWVSVAEALKRLEESGLREVVSAALRESGA